MQSNWKPWKREMSKMSSLPKGPKQKESHMRRTYCNLKNLSYQNQAQNIETIGNFHVCLTFNPSKLDSQLGAMLFLYYIELHGSFN